MKMNQSKWSYSRFLYEQTTKMHKRNKGKSGGIPRWGNEEEKEKRNKEGLGLDGAARGHGGRENLQIGATCRILTLPKNDSIAKVGGAFVLQ